MDVALVGLFRDLIRLETELWNRVDVEAAALCRRNANPTNGRANLIQLTQFGMGLLAEADVTFSAGLATHVVDRPAMVGVAAQPIQTVC